MLSFLSYSTCDFFASLAGPVITNCRYHIKDDFSVCNNDNNFEKELYEKMQKGAYITIGDTLIDTKASKENVKNQFENIYYNSSKDAYWNCLSGLSDEQVKYALNLQNATREKTKKQVEYAVARDGIYPVSRDWMFDNVKKIGFKIIDENEQEYIMVCDL